jgi:hypothetical protein
MYSSEFVICTTPTRFSTGPSKLFKFLEIVKPLPSLSGVTSRRNGTVENKVILRWVVWILQEGGIFENSTPPKKIVLKVLYVIRV